MAARGPQIVELVHRSLTQTIYDVRWLPGTAKFLALGCYARGTGTLQLYELDGAALELAAETEQPASLKCACVLGGGGETGSAHQQLIALGNFDGQLQLVDAERLGSSSEPLWRVQTHAGVVNGLDAFNGQGAPLIATAGKDGGVRVWDPRAPDAPAAAFLPAAGGPAPDAWCVAIGNAHSAEERCILAGYANGDIKMFDLRGGGAAVRWETNVGKGVCGVQFDRRDIAMNKFVATCLESRLCLYDARTQHPTRGFAGRVDKVGRDATLWVPRHLPQNRDVFMVTGGDGSLLLHRYRYPDQRVIEDKRTGEKEGVVGSAELLCDRDLSCQPVAAFDWSPDKAGVFVAAAFDQTVRVGMVGGVAML
ncbi:hypothetical protein COHA_007138 [Chlorella ohadii]|uniref:WD repeat-containing protein 92 n=1 Tax=Chlorella ohadii TaxID=2649997 RepID=A0AAD5H3S1_9CHLO|nr:hypothetical protein COHA_007138 [Chlorella ohadii]